EAVPQPVRAEADGRSADVRDPYDGRIGRLEVARRRAVDLVQLDVLEAHVEVELALPERVGALEEERPERVGRALEDLELRVVLVRKAGGGGHDREVPSGGVRDRVAEGVERAAPFEADAARGRGG